MQASDRDVARLLSACITGAEFGLLIENNMKPEIPVRTVRKKFSSVFVPLRRSRSYGGQAETTPDKAEKCQSEGVKRQKKAPIR